MSHIDEHIIIRRILDGERDAYRHLIRAYQQMCYSIAISIVKNHSDAQDAVQNALIIAYRRLHTYRSEAKFSSWLYRIVTNEAIKVSRNSQKRRSVQADHATTPVDNEAIQSLEIKEKQALISSVLTAMKPKEALVLKLYYLHEMSAAEIHDSTGWSSSNIKTLLHRARHSFNNIYQKYHGEIK